MKPHSRVPEQDDLLRPRLVDMIDWDFFEREWVSFFPSHQGRPATSPRLVAGLIYLQHAFKLSDEAVVARGLKIPTTSISPARRFSCTTRRSIPPRWCAGASDEGSIGE